MYGHQMDTEEGLLVGLFSGPSNSDEDFTRYVDSLLQGAKQSNSAKPQIAVLVVDRDNPPPNAYWRKRIAEATSHIGGNGGLFVLSAESPLIRGVLTAINWIRPPKYEVKIVASPDEMLEVLATRSDVARTAAARMLAELRAEARQSTR